jgi:predicted Co/Zn/Cd cation transporter (cation efflux family)
MRKDLWNARPAAANASREQAALLVSVIATVVMATLGVVWGLAVRSQLILFDGVYGMLGIVLSGLSLHVSRLVAAGPTTRFPFGREALAPLVVAIQGIALGGTCAYAVVTSLLTIVDGGSAVVAGWAVVYGAVSMVVSFVVYLWMRPRARSSGLVAAEAVQWLFSAGLGVAMVVAFGAMLGLQRTDWAGAADYIDPALVLLACVLVLPAPLRMVTSTLAELLEGAPPISIQSPVRAAVAEVTASMGLGETACAHGQARGQALCRGRLRGRGRRVGHGGC